MKILVIGGTAFLGRHLIETAMARGHDLSMFNRMQLAPDLFPNIERLRGDRQLDLKALHGRQWDAVIDTCGYLPRDGRAMAQALKGQVGHYTFISSLSVYKDFSKEGLEEMAPVQTLTAAAEREAEQIVLGKEDPAVSYGLMYGPLKALCEQAIETVLPGRVLTVRSGLIVGPYDYTDKFTYWPRRLAAGGEVLAPGNPVRPVQLIDVRDLSEWILRMVELQVTGVFNVSGPADLLTMREILEQCRQVTNSKAELIWVDDLFLLEAGVIPWLGMPLWIPSCNPDLLGVMSINCQKAIASGLHFRPLRETIADVFRWDRERPAGAFTTGLDPDREVALLGRWQQAARQTP